MSYDINVLCNGNRCKQYLHNGRTFVEAKEGSEYVIEIKNNSWEKVLAVVSVDGLNIIDGITAETDGPGYVMNKYTAQKFYGFQYSQEKVATFKFGAMGQRDAEGNPLGYAASKGDGSEKNTGVIGVRIWDEVPRPPAPVVLPNITITPYAISSSWASYSATASYALTGGCSPMGILRGHGITNTLLSEAIADAKAVRQTALASCKSADAQCFTANIMSRSPDPTVIHGLMSSCITNESFPANVMQDDLPDNASFDMETQWGTSKNYKVKETTFERRNVVHSFDIYYASRESLLAMGVDLGTEKRVSFPSSFKEDKYAKPPKGWKA